MSPDVILAPAAQIIEPSQPKANQIQYARFFFSFFWRSLLIFFDIFVENVIVRKSDRVKPLRGAIFLKYLLKDYKNAWKIFGAKGLTILRIWSYSSEDIDSIWPPPDLI